jgi:hypothetical protein
VLLALRPFGSEEAGGVGVFRDLEDLDLFARFDLLKKCL